MTNDVARIWVLAELTAALSGSPATYVAAGGDELPSRAGVYVTPNHEAPRGRLGDTAEIRVRVYTAGDDSCSTLVNGVAAILNHNPGTPKNWIVNPISKNLRLKSIKRLSVKPPERDGEGGVMWDAVIVFVVEGRDATMPA